MRFVPFALCLAWLPLQALAEPAPKLAGTTLFEPPVELRFDSAEELFGDHAVTRLVDWDGDGDADLLVGGGDGRCWWLMNAGGGRFAAPDALLVDGSPLRLGRSFTTVCASDMDGDGDRDLVVAHSDTLVVWLENLGSANKPRLTSPRPLQRDDGSPLVLPRGCGARIDVGDWDGDGDVDLVAGAFTGPILGYANVGTAARPRFAAGVPLALRRVPTNYSYNVHPTLFDVNQDGRIDVAYGLNWGTVGFLIASDRDGRVRRAEGKLSGAADNITEANRAAALPLIRAELAPGLSTGQPLDLRSLAGDDATPTFADLDGDGTLDMLSGGRKGRLYLLKGVPLQNLLDRLDALLSAHPDDLGRQLQARAELRGELSGLQQGVYRWVQGFLTSPAARRPVRDWMARHVERHARWLRHARRDIESEPYVPSLAYQTWTTLLLLHDGDPDAIAHREWVADTIGLTGRLRQILVEFGTLIIENGRATPNQQETLYSYLSQVPRELLGDRSVGLVTQVITIGEYLGPRWDVLHEGGVNIFASESGKPKSSENPFPKDFVGCENDYFGVVLAHELNHRVDVTRCAAVPSYNEKYWRHLRKIAGSDVKFSPRDGIGVDWEATKRHFVDSKLWDGRGDWNKAWADYWLTGPGKSRVLNVCRNETTYTPPRFGIPFFLETRQESIASLANQYFSDSVLMLQFALDRYRRGAPGCLDEWLLMADLYSLGQAQTFLYRHRNGSVHLERTVAPLARDAQGNIASITVGGTRYVFELDGEGLVEKVREERP